MAPGEVVMEGQHPHPRGHGHNLLSVTQPIRIRNSERWAESIDQLRWLLEAIAWVRQLGTSGQHSTELYTIDSYKETLDYLDNGQGTHVPYVDLGSHALLEEARSKVWTFPFYSISRISGSWQKFHFFYPIKLSPCILTYFHIICYCLNNWIFFDV